MAWLGSISYPSGTAVTNTLIENLNKDIRTWGGNVDGGGFNLANVTQVSTAAGAAVCFLANGSSGAYVQFKSSGTSKGYIGYVPLGAGGIGILDAAGSGTPLLFVDSSGKVCIGGGTAPTSNLQVTGLPSY